MCGPTKVLSLVLCVVFALSSKMSSVVKPISLPLQARQRNASGSPALEISFRHKEHNNGKLASGT